MSLTSLLYTLGRLSADLKALSSGHTARRVKNRALGRTLAQTGLWRRLWR